MASLSSEVTTALMWYVGHRRVARDGRRFRRGSPLERAIHNSWQYLQTGQRRGLTSPLEARAQCVGSARWDPRRRFGSSRAKDRPYRDLGIEPNVLHG